MPFINGCFYGSDAQSVQTVTQDAFMALLRQALNDPAGPYQARLSGLITVTMSAGVADEKFKAGSPVVSVILGPSPGWSRTGLNLSGGFYAGKRHELTLEISISAASEALVQQSPALADDADRKLVSAVTDIVRSRIAQFNAAGLFNIDIRGDGGAQRDYWAPNPHAVSYFSKTLDSYAP